MIVKVVLFAMAKELTGASQVELEIEEGSSVGDLRGKLSKHFPNAKDLIERSAVSVDHEFAIDEQIIGGQSEIALIPPVSGG